MNMDIFTKLSYGVYVVSTMDGDRPTGCIANSVMQITAEPATLAVSMNHNNYTNECMEMNGSFALSVLAENSDASLIGRFGFQSGRTADKFADCEYELVQGVPAVKDSCGYVVCRIINKMETATHTVFLGEVLDAGVYGGGRRPMTYAYYHEVVKGRSPKNAPTYRPEETEETQTKETADGQKKSDGVKYVCEVCGYVYEGEPLPADFVCPICGVGPDKFRRVEE